MERTATVTGLTATTIALVLLAATAAVGAEPPETAAANLRDMTGQAVVGEQGLVWKVRRS